jgi:hypothetical protein
LGDCCQATSLLDPDTKLLGQATVDVAHPSLITTASWLYGRFHALGAFVSSAKYAALMAQLSNQVLDEYSPPPVEKQSQLLLQSLYNILTHAIAPAPTTGTCTSTLSCLKMAALDHGDAKAICQVVPSTPSDVPSLASSINPSDAPIPTPSSVLSSGPSIAPSSGPSDVPSKVPSLAPSSIPSDAPSISPSSSHSRFPSLAPPNSISHVPSLSPSCIPSGGPSLDPSSGPRGVPSLSPSSRPSHVPSLVPSRGFSDVSSSAPALVLPGIPPVVRVNASLRAAKCRTLGLPKYRTLHQISRCLQR